MASSIANQVAQRLLFLDRRKAEIAAERVARIIAAGPPPGSRISPEAWESHHRYSFVVCPGRKGEWACTREECRKGASCEAMAAKGQYGDGSEMPRRQRPTCGAKTRAGGSCAMRVEPGKHRCRLHGGLSTGPKTEEGRERIREAQRRRWSWKHTPDVHPGP